MCNFCWSLDKPLYCRNNDKNKVFLFVVRHYVIKELHFIKKKKLMVNSDLLECTFKY
jgi:hypothetical protein